MFTEARWLIRDGTVGGWGGGGERRKSEGSTADTARKSPERPWTAARTMEVLRRCPLAIAQRLVHCTIAVFQLLCLGRVTKTMSVALLLKNNLRRKKSNFRSPAPPPCWANVRVQLHLPPLDLAWNPLEMTHTREHTHTHDHTQTHTHTRTHSYTHTHAHARTLARTHASTHTHTRTRTHSRTQVRTPVSYTHLTLPTRR